LTGLILFAGDRRRDAEKFRDLRQLLSIKKPAAPVPDRFEAAVEN